LVCAAEIPVLCLVKGDFNQGVPYDAPGSYWMILSGPIENCQWNEYYIDVEVLPVTSLSGFVVIKFKHAVTAESNVYAYFYNTNGAGGRNVACATYAGYAFRFTVRNDFPGRVFITPGDVEMFFTAGSFIEGEYEWLFTKRKTRLTYSGAMQRIL
ncbi:hypothetical protein V1507DRAFT_393860, partial [Lipomyces tetrasporus]